MTSGTDPATRLDAPESGPKRADVELGSPDIPPWRQAIFYQKLALGAVCLFLLALILVPVGRLIFSAFVIDGAVNLTAFERTVEQPWFGDVIFDTVTSVLAGSLLALVMASILAWLNERTDAGLGWLGGFMPLLPLLMPAIAMAAGWVFMASPQVGFINGLLEWLPGDISVNILSRTGLMFVYMVALVPYAYVTIAGALRNVDPSLEEASLVSGAGLLRTFIRVSIPSISNAILAALLFTTVIGFALYSVPTVVGLRAGMDIMSVRIIRSVNFTFPQDIQTATVLSVMMLAAISIVWSLHNFIAGRGRFAMISGRSGSAKVSLGRWRHLARFITISYLIATTVVPFLGLLLVSVQPFWTSEIDFSNLTWRHYDLIVGGGVGARAIQNSVLLGVVGGAVAVAIGIFIGMSQRSTASGLLLGAGWTRLVDGVSKMPAAISSVVIGLAFLLTFSDHPFRLGGSVILLLMAYVVVFLPQASIASTSAMAQIGPDLAEASYVSGAGELRTFSRVTFPLMWPGIASAWALVFVLVAAELPASTMLASPGTPVMGFVLADIWEGGLVGQMAAFGVVVTVVMSVSVSIFFGLGRLGGRRVK